MKLLKSMLKHGCIVHQMHYYLMNRNGFVLNGDTTLKNEKTNLQKFNEKKYSLLIE